MVCVKTSYQGLIPREAQVLVMASVKECSVRCIDFFVSLEYLVLSTFVVTELGRE